MVDTDGNLTHSQIIAFSRVNESGLLLHPNPVRNKLQVMLNTGNRKQLSLKIFDETDKQFYRQSVDAVKGNKSYQITVNSFLKRIYYIHVVTDNGVETTRFIKQ